MIICGERLLRVGVVPIFFCNLQQPIRSFFAIAGSRCDHFLKSSAPASNFFLKPHQRSRPFFIVLNKRFELLPGFSSSRPGFFIKICGWALAGQITGTCSFQVIDPPRGRPFGGGGVARLWRYGGKTPVCTIPFPQPKYSVQPR